MDPKHHAYWTAQAKARQEKAAALEAEREQQDCRDGQAVFSLPKYVSVARTEALLFDKLRAILGCHAGETGVHSEDALDVLNRIIKQRDQANAKLRCATVRDTFRGL